MKSGTVEPRVELKLALKPAPDELALSSTEFQRKLWDFHRALKAEGIGASAVHYAFDAVVGQTGLTGEFILPVVMVSSVAITQAVKLIETMLRIFSGGTTFEVRKGDTVIKGSARDVGKVLPPELLAKLLDEERKRQ